MVTWWSLTDKQRTLLEDACRYDGLNFDGCRGPERTTRTLKDEGLIDCEIIRHGPSKKRGYQQMIVRITEKGRALVPTTSQARRSRFRLSRRIIQQGSEGRTLHR